jgi:glycosyltransferase involved in cell wall biosynthesis
LYKCEAERLARYEKQLTQVFGTSIVASKAEAQELGGGGCHGVCVVENGVSAPSVKDEAALPEAISQLQPYVVFVGTMNYRPNVDAVVYFTEEILPLVRQRHPELRFLIVGRDPARPVRKLTRLPGVVVTGSVPDVSPYLAGARVAVAPFRIAQGVQNKVLEALARGLPVVLTSRSARPFSSLPAQTLLVADTPKDFAEAVISALEDPLVARRCQAAAAHVRERFDWQNHFAQLSHLLEERAVSPGSAAGRVPNYVSIS